MKSFFGQGRLLIAHRGGAQRWPENTLLAFQRAYDLGYRWIETDVQLSADGELVLFHDLALERTTDGEGPLAAQSLAELRRLDAAYHFSHDGQTFPHRGTGVRIPTLAEALAMAPDLYINLEMKGRDRRLPELLWRFIDTHGVHDRVLVASANDAMTARFRSVASERVATSAGKRGIFGFWLAVRAGVAARLHPPWDALQVPVRHGALQVVDRRFVEAAHALRVKVHVWTVNDPIEMRWLDGLGVDGIMSDRPQVLLETLGDGSPP